jgi:hypothetical protein
MKNEKSLFSLSEFWLSLILPIVVSIIVAIIIFQNSNLKPDLSYEGFNNLINIYKVPLAILALLFPLVALVASNHRSRQSAAQLESGRSQNNFSNYYKHRESFHDMLVRLEIKYDVTFFDSDSLYKILFPDNSPVDLIYSLQKQENNFIQETRDLLHSWIDDSCDIEETTEGGIDSYDLIKLFYERISSINERLKFRPNSGVYINWTRKYKHLNSEIKEEETVAGQRRAIYLDSFYTFGHITLCDELMRSIAGFCQIDNYKSVCDATPIWTLYYPDSVVFNTSKEFGSAP